jgi:hypothetical protein
MASPTWNSKVHGQLSYEYTLPVKNRMSDKQCRCSEAISKLLSRNHEKPRTRKNATGEKSQFLRKEAGGVA